MDYFSWRFLWYPACFLSWVLDDLCKNLTHFSCRQISFYVKIWGGAQALSYMAWLKKSKPLEEGQWWSEIPGLPILDWFRVTTRKHLSFVQEEWSLWLFSVCLSNACLSGVMPEVSSTKIMRYSVHFLSSRYSYSKYSNHSCYNIYSLNTSALLALSLWSASAIILFL